MFSVDELDGYIVAISNLSSYLQTSWWIDWDIRIYYDLCSFQNGYVLYITDFHMIISTYVSSYMFSCIESVYRNYSVIFGISMYHGHSFNCTLIYMCLANAFFSFHCILRKTRHLNKTVCLVPDTRIMVGRDVTQKHIFWKEEQCFLGCLF